MQPATRSEITTVTLDKLPGTDRECHECEEGTFKKDGYEIVCDTCHYTPVFTERASVLTEWDLHEKQIRERADGDSAKRPRLVGGYREAYWGSNEYEYDPSERSFRF